MPWQFHEAKQKFSQLVEQAIAEGPQPVTRNGETVVVVLSVEDYRRLTAGKWDFTDFLLSGPDLSPLDAERSTNRPRDAEL